MDHYEVFQSQFATRKQPLDEEETFRVLFNDSQFHSWHSENDIFKNFLESSFFVHFRFFFRTVGNLDKGVFVRVLLRLRV